MSWWTTGVRGEIARVVLGGLVAVLASGCSGGDDDPSAAAEERAGESTASVPDDASSTAVEQSQLVAQSDAEVEVWERPDEDDPSQVLAAEEMPSEKLTFLVLEELDDEWLEVQLPTPPLGATGYLRRSDVSLNRHRYHIEISRSEHSIKVFAGDVEAINEPVAIGPDAPAADTTTYVKELLFLSPDTPYAGHVYGLAGWSNTVDQLGSGQGVVAIHGTNPEALGTDSLTGAVGVDQRVLNRMANNIGLPLGTPVTIRD
jgi:hypothetical protein